MNYVNNEKHSSIALLICLILALCSPSYNKVNTVQTIVPTVEAKTIQNENEYHNTYSGSTEVEITKKIREENPKCDYACKVETLIKLGINSKLANSIVKECKEGSSDPVHCIKVASAITINESGGGKSNACKTRYNCMGIGSGKAQYSSLEEAMDNWVVKYNKYWYKANDMSFFYSKSGTLPPSRYCTSESSSDSDIGCPHGLAHSSKIFNRLNELF